MRSESFDIRPAHEASAADLSHRLFDDYRASTVSLEVIAANHRSNEEKYASLRCFDLIAHCPTVAGILLFGKNPRYFLPGAYVQFIRFPGTTMTERPIDQKEIDGDLRTVVEALRGRIDAHNAVALGEGAGSVTRDTLTRRNAYRNPVLAEALKAMDYVNKFGHGLLGEVVTRTGDRDGLDASGLPIPEPANDPYMLALLRHYHSLMPMAVDAHKPMFFLKPADGAIGSHIDAVRACYKDFEALARKIATNAGVMMG
jgi:predicted HTH transcriptional regulator